MMTNLKNLINIGITILTLAGVQQAHAFSGGISGYSGQAGNNCSLCHSGGAVPTVTLSGPNAVLPGSISTYTLTISGAQANSGGLDVSVDAGTLINTVTGTRLQSGEITHTSRTAANGNGDVVFSFDWQAPASAGTANIYSAGLSTNGDGNTTGDGVATIISTIDVTAAAPEPPTAAFTAPQTTQVNTTVTFNGSASFDPDGTIVSYDWDFGDGNTAPNGGAIIIHSYSTAGVYTVSLTVTDDTGMTHSTFRDITVGGIMIPVSDPGGPYNGTVGQPVDFDGSASTHDSPIVNYIWDFGDGTAFVTTAGPTVSHTYTAAGAYTMTLAVQDASNVTGVASTVVVIADVPQPPVPPDGAALYGSNCSACHGPLASSAKLNKTATQIQGAIDSNTGGMGGLSGLTPEEVQAIADALVSTAPPPPPPTDGPTLYANNCSGCHGPLETSTKLNKTATQITAAINANTGGMGGLSSLTATQIQAIADALVTATPPPPPPTDGPTLYANNCSACHGPLASSSKLNKTSAQIQGAIDSNTGGMGGLSSLTPTEVQAIADALVSTAPPPPPPADGQTLYANNCSGCHGPLATSSKLNKTAAQITAAINANTGGMGGLSSLSATQIQAIADALVSVTPPPEPTTGEGLYNSYCLVCHGAGGNGGQYEAVRNSSASDIASAISGVSLMNSLSSLSSQQLQAISDYLSGDGGGSTPPPEPTIGVGEQLYNSFCLACHGTDGRGGLYEGIRGASASSIDSAISSEQLMNSLSSLTSEQVGHISDFLNGIDTPPAPAPTDGASLYTNNCAGCHGPLASSTKLDRTAAQITAAITSVASMNGLSSLTATNIQAIADALSTGGTGGGGGGTPAPTDGAALYTNNCSGCHGPLETSAKQGRSASQIQAAINANTGGMGGLSNLTPTEVQAIADALAGTGGGGGGGGTTPTTGETLYISLCQGCHGVNGTGGSAKAVVGVSANQITNAIASIGSMSSINISGTDAQNIADFLASGGGVTPEPTTGIDLYNLKCAACHGPEGRGGTEEAVRGSSLSSILSAMTSVPEMQPIPLTEGQAQAIANYLNGSTYGGGGDGCYYNCGGGESND